MMFALRNRRDLLAPATFAIFFALFSKVSPLAGEESPTQDLPTATALFERLLEVTILEPDARQRRFRHAKGWVEISAFGLEGSFESWSRDSDRFLSELRFDNVGLVSRGFNGNHGWTVSPFEGNRLLGGSETLSERFKTIKDKLADSTHLYEKIRTVARVEFQGVDCYKVELIAAPLEGMDPETTLELRTATAFFEVESGLLRGNVERIDPPTGPIQLTNIYTKYKPFEGALYATEIRQEFQGIEVVLGIEAIDFRPIDDSVLALPAVIQAMLPGDSQPETSEELSPTAKKPSPLDDHANSEAKTQSSRQPSVLFYLIDTCRADRMGVHGAPHFTTPFLSELAKRSVVFENCNSQAPWTKPSMAAILTSRYPSEIGMTKMFASLANELQTFPEALRKHGWHTAGFSANPIMGRLSNYTQGFAEFVESSEINAADPIHFASGSAQKLNQKIFPWLDANPVWPKFLYVHSVDPHEEYEPDPEFLEKFSDPKRMDEYRKQWQTLLRSRPPVPGNHLTQENFDRTGIDASSFIEQGKKLYDADILANDAEIGRLWERLSKGSPESESTDAWGEDTVVVVTSDHGEEFFEHGGTCHGYGLYQELIHVPLMIFAPGRLPEGVRIKQPVASIDIYPTLLDILGLEIPSDIRGRSLLPLIEAPQKTTPATIYSEQSEDPGGRMMGSGSGIGMSIIEGRWKFILSLRAPQGRNRERYELFDHLTDPQEKNNVAGDHPDVVARLEKQLMEWSASNLGLVPAKEVARKDIDQASLEALRQLGYIVDDESEAPSGDGRRIMPSLAQAVLDGDVRWDLYALGGRSEEAGRTNAKLLRGHLILDRGTASVDLRDKIASVLYRNLNPLESTKSRDDFAPCLGIHANFRGHVVTLLLDGALGSIQVYVDDLLLANLSCGRETVTEIEELALDAGVETRQQ